MTEERKILSKCSEITMDKFIDCLCNKNYLCLVLNGTFTDLELSENWQNVFYEYCDLTNSNQYKQMLSYLKKIGVNEAKLTVINLCLIVLSHERNQECIDLLKKYGYNQDFAEYNTENYLNDLKNVQSVSKMAVINLQSDRVNLERIVGSKQNHVAKETDFDKTFIVLSKFMGYPVRKNATFVSEYCSMIQMINKK